MCGQRVFVERAVEDTARHKANSYLPQEVPVTWEQERVLPYQQRYYQHRSFEQRHFALSPSDMIPFVQSPEEVNRFKEIMAALPLLQLTPTSPSAQSLHSGPHEVNKTPSFWQEKNTCRVQVGSNFASQKVSLLELLPSGMSLNLMQSVMTLPRLLDCFQCFFYTPIFPAILQRTPWQAC